MKPPPCLLRKLLSCTDIFDKYYDNIFGEKVLNVEESPTQIKKYFDIRSLYEAKAKTNDYDVSDQKVFYILYLQYKTNRSEEELIDAFEEVLLNYNPLGKEPMTPARKLILLDFKVFIDEQFSVQQ